ncbi:hypothetical protein ACIQKE_01210 [Streptomyces griseoviridis]|uniref:DUF7144 domain-containing protein n=2 Tax=Streptomyces TaxID=1883 RepID=A0A3S9Z8A7_STRGD|nr:MULTISPECIES: hypothetical protein [Streptomyces]AZS84033.1 hypothetical protein ELQ87_06780 [Streptomyces griseoviridis]MDT0472875.1 hypothetical protein [Streptomyces sp. DSM 41014]QCN89110.1 hypothetical protein DDJ31_32575 [Streptomyces griseoviridis]
MSQHPAEPSGIPSGTPQGGPQDTWSGGASPRSGQPPEPPQHARHGGSGWVTGGVVFAGVLMLCSGILAVLQGIAAISSDDVYGRVGTYVYELNLTGWGWIHVILGALVAITGLGVLKGATWARFLGIFLVSLSLIAQFLFLPYLPVWSVVMMAIDVFVIWALASQQESVSRRAV